MTRATGWSRRTALVAALLVCAPSSARASAADVFGLGSVEGSVAGASSARVHDFSAAYYNPAGLASVSTPQASVGLMGHTSRLRVEGAGAMPEMGGASYRPISGPLGILIGAAGPIPFGGVLRDRLYLGVALHVLPDGIAQVIAHKPDEPFFPLYDNRSQRLLVLPSIALRLPWGLSAGVAFNFLAGLGGHVVAGEGATRAIEARVDEQIFSTLKINVGLRWRSPSDRYALAVVYREAFSVPFSTTTRNTVAGQPIHLDVDAEGLYTPHQIVFGGAVRAVPFLLLSADVTASLWSRWQGPFVRVQSELPIVGALVSPLPALQYRDAVSIRLGADATVARGRLASMHVRAGYGFETSPIPREQPGITNELDGPKHLFTAGLGIGFAHVRLDVHGQMQVLHPSMLVKQVAAPGTHPDPALMLRDERPDGAPSSATPSTNPGWPQVTGSGWVASVGLTLTVSR